MTTMRALPHQILTQTTDSSAYQPTETSHVGRLAFTCNIYYCDVMMLISSLTVFVVTYLA